jgi:uncharacterized protein with PIN domain
MSEVRKKKEEEIGQFITEQEANDEHTCPICDGCGKIYRSERGDTKRIILLIIKRFRIKERQAYRVYRKIKRGKK